MMHDVDVLIHINVTVQVEADTIADAFVAAEAMVRTETVRRGFDPEDIASVEAI